MIWGHFVGNWGMHISHAYDYCEVAQAGFVDSPVGRCFHDLRVVLGSWVISSMALQVDIDAKAAHTGHILAFSRQVFHDLRVFWGWDGFVYLGIWGLAWVWLSWVFWGGIGSVVASQYLV